MGDKGRGDGEVLVLVGRAAATSQQCSLYSAQVLGEMPVLLACDLVATNFTAWNGGDLLPQRDVHCWKLTQTLEMPHGVSILHHTGVDILKELYAILSL